MKKVRVIKVINTLSASTCELVDEYSNSPVSDVQAENFYFQVKFINCYLREVISFTKKNDIRDWGQSKVFSAQAYIVKCPQINVDKIGFENCVLTTAESKAKI